MQAQSIAVLSSRIACADAKDNGADPTPPTSQREEVVSLDAEAVSPNSNGDGKDWSRCLNSVWTSGDTSEEESSKTSSAMTTPAKGGDDRLGINGQTEEPAT